MQRVILLDAEWRCHGASLRKTAINNAIRNGAAMQKVREFAGRAEIRTTEVYLVRKESAPPTSELRLFGQPDGGQNFAAGNCF
jgi:hypothetical protein